MMMIKNDVSLSKLPKAYVIRTYDKRKGPYFLMEVDGFGRHPKLVEKLDSLDGISSEMADELISKGDELYKEVRGYITHLRKHL